MDFKSWWLQTKTMTTWETDKIEQLAKGLEYLHHGCERPVIHRDVKSSNILLDEHLKPRIADFGLAKIVQTDTTNGSTHVIAGTHGYIAPGKFFLLIIFFSGYAVGF